MQGNLFYNMSCLNKFYNKEKFVLTINLNQNFHRSKKFSSGRGVFVFN